MHVALHKLNSQHVYVIKNLVSHQQGETVYLLIASVLRNANKYDPSRTLELHFINIIHMAEE